MTTQADRPADAAGTTWVLSFAEGHRGMADLLGGKGANLAEMTRLGLPVPPGFTITTQACRAYLAEGHEPEGLAEQVEEHLRRVEDAAGRRFGDPADPLLVSVRSGARFSMPGMMDTILNVGLTDETLPGLARRAGDRFAQDCYRRLVQMYGRTVLGVDGQLFEDVLDQARQRAGVRDDQGLDAAALADVATRFRELLREHAGEDLPQDPREQLTRAVRAVFESWNSPRAVLYRSREGIDPNLGTAVNVVAMVFGNTGERSGSGVCFTRDPASGHRGAYGDYLTNAQGEDVVAGIRQPVPLARLADIDPPAYEQLMGHLATLENHYRDLCDVEFTIEDGRLWILQTRVGKRTAGAAFRIATQLVDEGVIDLDEALRRVTGEQLTQLLHPRFAADQERRVLARGLPASPGAAVGEAVLDSQRAVEWAAQGRTVVLVRPETSPEDLPGMVAAVAVVTARGGLTSHAAVVARGMGRTCVAGAEGLQVDLEQRVVTGPGGQVREGDVISVDGTAGVVSIGELDVEASVVAAALEDPGAAPDDELVEAVARLLAHADLRRTTGVLTNADTPEDARRARRLGAEGIGLCRTEHMLLGERRHIVEDIVLDRDRETAFSRMHDLHREEFRGVLEAMDGLPVVVRLLDPPLHEFLPDLTELSVHAALEEAAGRADEDTARLLAGVRRWHEANPMLGLRGVRLVAVVPELYAVQARALAHATADLLEKGFDPRPELMVPLVAEAAELAAARRVIEQAVRAVADERGATVSIPVGSMIELPRAALTAGEVARHADFFSFGTNDLTQTTWGLSRDDAEASFMPAYRESGLVPTDPFDSIDVDGVGRLVRIAVAEGRATRPDLGLGICGEHGGDPASVRFFAEVGLDYVSCSPPRVPAARLEAGRAVVLAEGASEADTR
ncbi:pyruvate, phosphate dikinase [Kineosporiaceae bacterium SCSIO 59966]|nr:pyruvate, phosphate dikinase [Kineosporiaceae bacterium SCSIO 59966]